MHRTEFRVYYEDTDAGGIMYHARHLAFAERARTEMLRAWGVPVSALIGECGLAFVVRRLEVSYRSVVRLDDVVGVETVVEEVGAARCRLRQVLRCGEGEVACLMVELACIVVENGRPARIPPRWHDVMMTHRSQK